MTADRSIVLLGGGFSEDEYREVDEYLLGTVLAGISAGAACWFETCLTDSFGPLAPLNDGLGLLTGSFCPHLNTEEGRPEVYRECVSRGDLPAGIGLDDGAAVRFTNEQLTDVFTVDESAKVHHFA